MPCCIAWAGRRSFSTSYDARGRGTCRPRSAAERGALLLQKAGFLIDAERFEEARDCFAQLAKMAPQSAGPQNGLAAAYAGLGQLDASVAAYEKSLAPAAGRCGDAKSVWLAFCCRPAKPGAP